MGGQGERECEAERRLMRDGDSTGTGAGAVSECLVNPADAGWVSWYRR